MSERIDIYPSKDELILSLPKRDPLAHKGQCGRVGIIAGSTQYLGAAILTARAALRSGAGMVFLMTVKEAVPYLAIQYPEIIVLPLPSKQGYLHASAGPLILQYVQDYRVNAIAIGPGLGIHKTTQKLVQGILNAVVSNQQLPAVIDADALNVLSEEFVKKLTGYCVLTPHAKEFERLFQSYPTDEKDRVLSTRRVSSRIDKIVVLKGHHTIIASPKHHVINPTGNEGMATAGMGDVLTGIIVGLIAQGVTPYDAAVLGCYLHGLSGDLVKAKMGIYSLIASDVIENLGLAFQMLQSSK